MSKDVSRIRQAGDIIKKSNHLQSGPRGAANEREKGGCDSGRRYPNSVTTLLRRRVSLRERGGVRIRDRAIHPLRFLITRRVYVKALRKTTHLALRSLAQCYAMNVSPVKKKSWGKNMPASYRSDCIFLTIFTSTSITQSCWFAVIWGHSVRWFYHW